MQKSCLKSELESQIKIKNQQKKVEEKEQAYYDSLQKAQGKELELKELMQNNESAEKKKLERKAISDQRRGDRKEKAKRIAQEIKEEARLVKQMRESLQEERQKLEQIRLNQKQYKAQLLCQASVKAQEDLTQKKQEV